MALGLASIAKMTDTKDGWIWTNQSAIGAAIIVFYALHSSRRGKTLAIGAKNPWTTYTRRSITSFLRVSKVRNSQQP